MMTSPSIETLDALNDYEEIFHFILNSVKSVCDIDGLTLAIHHKNNENNFILTDDLQWREMQALPQSLIKTTFESKISQIISKPDEYESFNIAIDCSGEERASALLLYPVIQEDTPIDIVLSLWKTFDEERNQIIEPLIVGSQQIGSTTRIKKTLIPKMFYDKDIEALNDIRDIIYTSAYKLLEQIEIQKETVLNQVQNNQKVFTSPQEIIATLINILMGVNSSVENIKDILEQVKKQTHPIDKTMPNIMLLREIVESLNQNLTNTFSFTANNDMVQALFRTNETVDTEEFFSFFSTFKQEIICKKNLLFNFFLAPKLPSEIKIERQPTYLFLNELLNFAFDDCDNDHDFDIIINHTESSLFFIVTYHKKIQQQENYLNLFTANKNNYFDNNRLYLSYKNFIQTGGKAHNNTDHDSGKVTFKITIPYNNIDSHPISDTIDNSNIQNIKIGLLLDKNRDLLRANNLARYMLALGLTKKHIKGAGNIELIQEGLTHLIIFQSQFSQALFEKILKNKSYKIMLISDSCSHNNKIQFYDFSSIDTEIDANQYYLEDLKDFLTLEAE